MKRKTSLIFLFYFFFLCVFLFDQISGARYFFSCNTNSLAVSFYNETNGKNFWISSDPNLLSCLAIRFGPDGDMYVLSNMRGKINKYDAKKPSSLVQAGWVGEDPSLGRMDLIFTRGRWVCIAQTTSNSYLQELSLNGSIIKTVQVSYGLNAIVEGLNSDFLYATNSLLNRVEIFHQSNFSFHSIFVNMTNPRYLAFGDGVLYVSGGKNISIFNASDASLLVSTSILFDPQGFTVHPDLKDFLYISGGGIERIYSLFMKNWTSYVIDKYSSGPFLSSRTVLFGCELGCPRCFTDPSTLQPVCLNVTQEEATSSTWTDPTTSTIVQSSSSDLSTPNQILSSINGNPSTILFQSKFTDSSASTLDITSEFSTSTNGINSTEEIRADESSSSSDQAGLIIGIIVGVLGALIIVLLVRLLWLRRRNRKLLARKGMEDPVPLSDLNTKTYDQAPNLDHLPKVTDVVIAERIGGGNFGEVFKGTAFSTVAVALKLLKDPTQKDEFFKEATVLASLRHTNVILFLGIFESSKHELYIVTEYAEKGSLLNLLRQSEMDHQSIEIETLVNMAIQTAAGMWYLEQKGIVHRDLAARNLLVDGNNNIKVSDFGLSKLMDSEYYVNNSSSFPVKWSSPEVLKFRKYSSKSDSWAFGIVLWELFSSGMMPYPSLSNAETLTAIVEHQYRMNKPDRCPSQVYEIMLKCWDEEPKKRPTFLEISQELMNFVRSEEFQTLIASSRYVGLQTGLYQDSGVYT